MRPCCTQAVTMAKARNRPKAYAQTIKDRFAPESYSLACML